MEFGLKEVLIIIVFVEGIILAIWGKIGLAKKSDIYNKDGTTKFMTNSMCLQTHSDLAALLGRVEAQIINADNKREATRNEISNCLKMVSDKLSELKGRFDTWEKIQQTTQK